MLHLSLFRNPYTLFATVLGETRSWPLSNDLEAQRMGMVVYQVATCSVQMQQACKTEELCHSPTISYLLLSLYPPPSPPSIYIYILYTNSFTLSHCHNVPDANQDYYQRHGAIAGHPQLPSTPSTCWNEPGLIEPDRSRRVPDKVPQPQLKHQ